MGSTTKSSSIIIFQAPHPYLGALFSFAWYDIEWGQPLKKFIGIWNIHKRNTSWNWFFNKFEIYTKINSKYYLLLIMLMHIIIIILSTQINKEQYNLIIQQVVQFECNVHVVNSSTRPRRGGAPGPCVYICACRSWSVQLFAIIVSH